MAEADVLIIAADSDVSDLVRTALAELEGVSAVACRGDQEVQQCLRAGLRPAVILLDFVLHDNAILATVGALKRDPRTARTPIVGLTVRYEARDEAKRAGCDYCLEKPFDLEDLLGAVRVLIAGKSAHIPCSF